jgi:hypothetical protein
VFTPIKALDLFANIGEGFRSPNQTEISPSSSLGPLGAPGGTPYPGLAVPKVKSHHFGATASMTDRWNVTVAKYRTMNENEIIQVSPGVFESVGNTTCDGWELESRVVADDWITLYGSLGKITRADQQSPAQAGEPDITTG